MKASGIKNFIVEVVTDQPLNIQNSHMQNEYVKETVVPVKYKSRRDTRKKARALQYCLEDGVNTLRNNDYVVHLDEETILTHDAIKGILNFISELLRSSPFMPKAFRFSRRREAIFCRNEFFSSL